MSSPFALDIEKLRFGYGRQDIVNLSKLQLQRDRSLAVIGPSGCGKTTFLHLLAGLIRPTAGTVKVLDQDLSALSDGQLDRFRGQRIGLVFQRFHLLPALTVMENVLLAQRLARVTKDSARIDMLFERLGITELARHKPYMLSQGQAQRVAIARALVHGPELVMADEPTSALDDRRATQALDLLHDSAKAIGASLLVVTHDQRVRGRLDQEFDMGTPQ
ncbi:MAG: ATP-binding cassette domain-containing protein [Pseudomonadota bacterium]